MRERSRIATVQRVDVRLDPVEKFRIGDRAGLDDLRDAGGQFTRRQRAQRTNVRNNRLRLVKRADHVLAERMIDTRLPAH